MIDRFPTRILPRVLVLGVALAGGGVHAAQWAKTYGGPGSETGSVYPAAGGGYYLHGSKNFTGSGLDTVYGKLNAAGALTWAKRVGGSKADSLFVEAVTGGFQVTGSTKSFPAPGVAKDNILWAKFDSNWNPVYAKVFGGAGTDENGYFVRTTEGGLLFVGSRTTETQSSSDSDILLINTRPDGTIKWKKALDYGPDDNAFDALEVSSGYLVAGTLGGGTVPPANDILVMKLAKAGGGILWKKLYSIDDAESTDAPYLSGITKASDGNFVLFGTLQPSSFLGRSRLFVTKIDATGTILWSKSYGVSTLNMQGGNVTENAANQTLLVSGSLAVADYMSPNVGNSSMFAMRLDGATGDIELQRRIGPGAQFNSGSVIKSGSVLYFTGIHAANLQNLAANPRVLFGRLNAATFTPAWAKTFGGPEANSKDYGTALKTATGYLLGGTTYSFGAATNTSGDIFGMTLDANGDYPDCFVEPLTLTSTNPGVAAAAVPWLVSAPALVAKANGNASAVVLPVTATTLPSTNICAPVAD